jgi:hypothetical protein
MYPQCPADRRGQHAYGLNRAVVRGLPQYPVILRCMTRKLKAAFQWVVTRQLKLTNLQRKKGAVKMGMRNEDLLSGWQEIADYLDKSIRTVQRWARLKGMPVRHPAGNGSTPHASKKNLENWALHSNSGADPGMSAV